MASSHVLYFVVRILGAIECGLFGDVEQLAIDSMVTG